MIRWWSLIRSSQVKKKSNIFNFFKMATGFAGSSGAPPNKDDLVEAVVCQNSDIKENEMKVFEIGRDGGQVLLVKQHGKIHALGSKCSHYGAPLVNGVLGNGRVRCPWHGACFNLTTGDIEDFPGLDSIPRYTCEVISGGGIKVTASKKMLKQNRVNRIMRLRDSKVTGTFVIIGAGAAGNNCAETLRHLGFQGNIVMISAENILPYDRIKLSKALNVEPNQIVLRSEEFYKEAGIEIKLNVKAAKVLTDHNHVVLNDKTEVEYNKLFICTGTRGRTIKIPGSELANIFTLRNVRDAQRINKQLRPEKSIVIVGSSFIGMEVASYCVGKISSITVVGRSDIPFKESLGEIIGSRIQELFEAKGVKFEMNATVKEYKSNDGVVSSVLLSSGKVLPANIVVIGMGTENNTEFLAGTEIVTNMNGTVPVDKFLETNIKNVFAGGDIALAPVFINSDKPAAIGHWQLAHYHGYIAAHNMLGKMRPLHTVPFFWTVLFGLSFRYAGYGGNYDDVVITGSLKDLRFVGYYCEGDTVNAVITVGSDPIASKFAELLTNNKKLKKTHISGNKVDWMDSLVY